MSLQRSARFALAALALLALSVLIRNAYFPLTFRAGLVVLALFAAVRPADALLVSALVGPFANLLAELMGSPPVRGYEAVTLAFLAGWLVHAPPARRGAASRRVLRPALLMIALVAASIVTLGLQLYAADTAFFWQTAGDLRGAYLWTADITGVIEGTNIIEGIALLVAIVELTEGAPGLALSLIKTIAISGAIATGLSVLLAAGVAPHPTLARQELFGKTRFSAHIADVNAAGSYFVLLLGLAAGMAASSIGKRQRWWFASLVSLIIGLGLSGSRSALAAALAIVAAAAGWLMLGRGWRRRSSLSSAGWIIILLLAGIAAAIFLKVPLTFGPDLRRDFTLASVRMIEARPVFGVGIGRYYPVSRLVLSPWLGALYGQENAHNYFLQMFAELGLAGLIILLWLVFTALRPAIVALRDPSRDYVSAGLLAGALAFLITCVSGHPLLLRESGFPFWMVLALALVTSGARDAPRAPSRIGTLAGVLGFVLILASIPFRVDPLRLRLRTAEEGFGPWLVDRDGKRYREAAQYSSLFVGPEVTALEIPIRRLPGREGHRLVVYDQESRTSRSRTTVGDSWSSVPITLPGAEPLLPYQRVNITIYEDDDRLPANPRASRVAIGEVNITAIRQ